MSSAPWFKFYPGDYHADTQRLTQAQHGAYMLLMLDYYSSGGPPPDDDQVLAGIARSTSLSDWIATRKAIARYFDVRDGFWYHQRCEEEIAKRNAEHSKKSDAGKKGNEIRWGVSQSDDNSDVSCESQVSQSDDNSDVSCESQNGRNTRYQIPDTRSQIPEPRNQTPKKTKPTKKVNGSAQAPFVLPDWIPEDHWRAWIESRQKARKSPTDYAKRLAVMKLDNLREQGFPPAQVLMQSAFNNWSGLFPVKEIK